LAMGAVDVGEGCCGKGEGWEVVQCGWQACQWLCEMGCYYCKADMDSE
jgi:hypothetical protein